MSSSATSVARLVVDFLVERKVDRVFGLQGGHIQPIWDSLPQHGIRIIDELSEVAHNQWSGLHHESQGSMSG